MKTPSITQVAYHPEPGRKLIFDVLATNSDGTLDLGYCGELVVGRCRLTQTVEIGSCTALDEEAQA